MIKVSKSFLGSEEISALVHVVAQDGYLGMGKEVQLFEEELAHYFGHEVVTCNTGTSALHLVGAAIGLKVDDEVLIPTLTYVASFQAISATGAKPVAVDIDKTTGFIDLESAKQHLSSKTKAIMPVYYAGSTRGRQDVLNFAKEHGLFVIEDGAQAVGEAFSYDECTDNIATCFSFDSIKILTCGEGGAVISPNKALLNKIRDLRLLGVEGDTQKRFCGERSWDFDVTEQGFRYHLSNLYASIGRAQLKKIDEILRKVRRVANVYLYQLSHLRDVEFLKIGYQSPHLFPILVPKELRDDLRHYLKQQDIQTGLHYKPNHLLTKFKTSYPLPQAEEFFECVISLPIHASLDNRDLFKIVFECERFFLSHNKERARRPDAGINIV